MHRLAAALIALAAAQTAARPGDLVWSTDEVLAKGTDHTFTAKGTRKGGRYLFKARGECKWEPMVVWMVRRWVYVRRQRPIFGITFKVAFGSGEAVLLKVGENRPESNAIEFVADRDDLPIRVMDTWDLPKGVVCTVDGIQVVVGGDPDSAQ